MSNSESEFIQLQITNIEPEDSSAFLIVSQDGHMLLLRPGLDSETAKTIQAEASQIIEEKALRLSGNKPMAKAWLDGKWSDFAFDLTWVYDAVLHCYEVKVVMRKQDTH